MPEERAIHFFFRHLTFIFSFGGLTRVQGEVRDALGTTLRRLSPRPRSTPRRDNARAGVEDSMNVLFGYSPCDQWCPSIVSVDARWQAGCSRLHV